MNYRQFKVNMLYLWPQSSPTQGNTGFGYSVPVIWYIPQGRLKLIFSTYLMVDFLLLLLSNVYSSNSLITLTGTHNINLVYPWMEGVRRLIFWYTFKITPLNIRFLGVLQHNSSVIYSVHKPYQWSVTLVLTSTFWLSCIIYSP